MEANLAAFAERAGVAVRYGCRWESTRARRTPTASRFVLETTDGEYRCRDLVFAVGVAEPCTPRRAGHRARRPLRRHPAAETYAGKRLFIIGKQNSGFELATGLLPWASRIVALVAVAGQDLGRDALARRRPRALRPAVRGHVLGGGVSTSSTRDRGRSAAPTDGARACTLERTRRRRRARGRGRRGHRRDRLRLPAARPARARRRDVRPAGCRPRRRAGRARRVPGHLLRRHDHPGRGAGSRSTASRPTPARSTATATTPGCWRAGIAEERFGIGIAPARDRAGDAPRVPHDRRSRARPSCGTRRPTSRASSASTPTTDSATRASCRWPHASTRAARTRSIVTLEADGSGAIYPVVYTRVAGAVEGARARARPAAPLRHAGHARGACLARRTRASGAGISVPAG